MNTAPCRSPASSLEHLSDPELLAATRNLVGRSNQLLAALLAHLAEVEARGIHRTRACSSLYTYCIYELRFSEDEAYRRVAASRLVRRFPALLDSIASGELHLTGLLLLGPHLTEQNLIEVLGRAKHRTKKEVAALVRVLDPLPDVPARIEPLGPASAPLASAEPRWAAFVQSLCPVRELSPGDRPRDWVPSGASLAANDGDGSEEVGGVGLNTSASRSTSAGAPPGETPAPEEPALARVEAQEPAVRSAEPAALEAPAPARVEPQRYRVQFTASEEYVQLVEEAQALLANSSPRAGLDEIHLRALRVLVAELKKQKYGVTSRPGKSPSPAGSIPAPSSEPAQGPEPVVDRDNEPEAPRQRGRYVPAAVRHSVFERDDGRCTYVSSRGERCRETCRLELHHIEGYALGGEHSEKNLTLRCRSHNALAAEEELGRDLVLQKRDSRGTNRSPRNDFAIRGAPARAPAPRSSGTKGGATIPRLPGRTDPERARSLRGGNHIGLDSARREHELVPTPPG